MLYPKYRGTVLSNVHVVYFPHSNQLCYLGFSTQSLFMTSLLC